MRSDEMLECPYPEITIRWADHWEEDEDNVSVEDALKEAKPYYGRMRGFLLGETKQVLVVASNIWEEDNGEWLVTRPFYIMKRAVVYRSDKDEGVDMMK